LFSGPDAGLVPVAARLFRACFEETNMIKSKTKPASVDKAPAATARLTKLDLLLAELGKEDGASIADLVERTGWQAHSVRGAMAGSLRKKGHVITSSIVKGVRRYRREKAAS
jgi:hypothetical protein